LAIFQITQKPGEDKNKSSINSIINPVCSSKNSDKKSTEKKEPVERREYVGIDRVLLRMIDEHIKSSILSDKFKPSATFEQFCEANADLLKEECERLSKNGINEPSQKIKKTYKNRYFIIVNSHNKIQ
jgi:hypothetical protein